MRQSFETLAFVATPTSDDVIDEQRVWSVKECAAVFASTVAQLAQQLAKEGDNGMLVWDKVTLQLVFLRKTPWSKHFSHDVNL